MTGRFPAARAPDGWNALSDDALGGDEVLAILVAFGGDRHVDRLGEAPIQWQFRSRGLGVVVASVTRRGDDVRARFTVRERESAPAQPRKEPAPKEGHGNQQVLRDAHHHAAHAAQVAPVAPVVHVKEAHDDGAREAARKPTVRLKKAEEPAKPRRSIAPGRSVAPAKRKTIAPGDGVRSPEAAPQHARRERRVPAALADLVVSARGRGASDLHVVADRPASIRLAGQLVPAGQPISARLAEELLLPIIPERLLEALEAHGSCDFALSDPKAGRARVNVTRQRTGYKGCFRLIPAEVPTLAGLELPEEIAKATRHHQGLIVVTGPTGHGKTTTLAAIVDHINATTTHHIVTVEDPVEYVHPRRRAMMSQREVGTHTRSFQRALKGSLREDPDVIVVGELRDLETVAMAVAASETGHLVLGTMNTPSAAKTIDRLIDLFPPGDQAQVRRTLAGGLKLVIGQRLVASVDRKRVHVAVELLTGTVALWNLIREEKTYQIPSLQQRGKSLGIVRLDDSLAALVRAGKVDESEAAAFAESPETFATAVRGQGAAAADPAAPRAGLLGGMFARKGG
ncbi:MAG: PilT/PilU family type 4a pilus ATPase [Deltaproteobacteria bacterium]|nr:PilT/PilU family type 4a pilus ATPase [Deltaproteobacteria bacterium]